MQTKQLFTVSAAARRLERSENTIRVYTETGRLSCVRTTNGRRLFRESDIEEFLKREQADAKPAA